MDPYLLSVPQGFPKSRYPLESTHGIEAMEHYSILKPTEAALAVRSGVVMLDFEAWFHDTWNHLIKFMGKEACTNSGSYLINGLQHVLLNTVIASALPFEECAKEGQPKHVRCCASNIMLVVQQGPKYGL